MEKELDDARFQAWGNGRFRERWGQPGKNTARSGKKLCLVATDPKFLIDLLYGLSLREDCCYVKYASRAREGMYLGRCFMQSDRAAAELCEQLKGHARLMVSLQDDLFFDAFRESAQAPGGCEVWDDWPEEAVAVQEIHTRTFGRPDEAAMVEAVRVQRAATVSLVAGVESQARVRVEGRIVGHILLSPVTIDGRDEPRGLGLAPLAVLPDYQRRGIGTRLLEAALRRARLLGHAYVVVLGHPEYYPRFGFIPASRFGLRYEPPVPDQAFMALELVPGCLKGTSGVVRFLPAFSAAG